MKHELGNGTQRVSFGFVDNVIEFLGNDMHLHMPSQSIDKKSTRDTVALVLKIDSANDCFIVLR